jgi:hypothetical protein
MSNIVLVLRSGGDFGLRDVELISRHINAKWQGEKPRIICLSDILYELPDVEFIPLYNTNPGYISKMRLFGDDMEQYRPFLYVDLDTAIIQSLEKIFELVKDESKCIFLEDLWKKRQLATGMLWIPAKSEKIKNVNKRWINVNGGGYKNEAHFLEGVIRPDLYWQHLTNGIVDFKPKGKGLLTDLPGNADVVCFHGRPRIFDAVSISWVNNYINE